MELAPPSTTAAVGGAADPPLWLGLAALGLLGAWILWAVRPIRPPRR